MAGLLDGDGLGHGVDAALGGGVAGGLLLAHLGEDAGHIDDGPLGLAQVGDGELAAVELAHQVGGQHPLIALNAHIAGVHVDGVVAGVIDHGVQPAVLFHGKVDEGLHLVRVGHVALEKSALAFSGGVELRGGGLALFLAPGGHDHIHARLAEHLGAAEADAGVGAGDDGHLALHFFFNGNHGIVLLV